MNSPAEIARAYEEAGVKKTKMSAANTFVLAVFAGAFIALGALGSSIASCGVPVSACGRVLSACVFPIGLMMVVIAGAELFTGNCLLVVPVLTKKTTMPQVLRNWVLVYLGNFVGGLFIALIAVYSHTLSLYGGDLAKLAVTTAVTKVNLTWLDAFLRGILCNVMVCIAVWAAFAANEVPGKILALYLPVFLFVLCGFEHCVANMYFIPVGIFAAHEYGIDAANLSWGTFIVNNLIPVTLGNIAGGSLLVGCGYWFTYLRTPKA